MEFPKAKVENITEATYYSFEGHTILLTCERFSDIVNEDVVSRCSKSDGIFEVSFVMLHHDGVPALDGGLRFP